MVDPTYQTEFLLSLSVGVSLALGVLVLLHRWGVDSSTLRLCSVVALVLATAHVAHAVNSDNDKFSVDTIAVDPGGDVAVTILVDPGGGNGWDWTFFPDAGGSQNGNETGNATITITAGGPGTLVLDHYGSGFPPSIAWTDQISLTAGTPSNNPPVAAGTIGTDDLVVDVDGTSSSDSDGTIVSYAWDWGDATADATTAIAQHTYAAAGQYTITLTVTDDDGATDTEQWLVTLTANQAPTAAFTITPNPQTLGQAVAVDATSSSDADGSIVSWSWSWGDATSDGSGESSSHTYASAGAYSITLTVTDDDGAIDTASQVVTIQTPTTGGGGESCCEIDLSPVVTAIEALQGTGGANSSTLHDLHEVLSSIQFDTSSIDAQVAAMLQVQVDGFNQNHLDLLDANTNLETIGGLLAEMRDIMLEPSPIAGGGGGTSPGVDIDPGEPPVFDPGDTEFTDDPINDPPAIFDDPGGSTSAPEWSVSVDLGGIAQSMGLTSEVSVPPMVLAVDFTQYENTIRDDVHTIGLIIAAGVAVLMPWKELEKT